MVMMVIVDSDCGDDDNAVDYYLELNITALKG